MAGSTESAGATQTASPLPYFTPTDDPNAVRYGQPATFSSRAGAYLIDGVFYQSFAVAAFLVLRLPEPSVLQRTFPVGMFQWGLLLTFLAYHTTLLSLCGRTIGKALVGLQVVPMDNARGDAKQLATGRAFRRTAAYLLSWLAFGLGFWRILFGGNQRTWHDQLAGTTVIYAKPARQLWPLLILQILLVMIGWGFLIPTERGSLFTMLMSQGPRIGYLTFDRPLFELAASIWTLSSFWVVPLTIIWPALVLGRLALKPQIATADFLPKASLGFAALFVVATERMLPTLDLFAAQRSFAGNNLFAFFVGLSLILLPPHVCRMRARDFATWSITAAVLLLLAVALPTSINANPFLQSPRTQSLSMYGYPGPSASASGAGVLMPLVTLFPFAVALPAILAGWHYSRAGNRTHMWIATGALIAFVMIKIIHRIV